jgi:hypothetical protein
MYKITRKTRYVIEAGVKGERVGKIFVLSESVISNQAK